MATIREQIQDGQHRANQIIEQIKLVILDLEKYGVALNTFKEEIESEIAILFNKQKEE